MADNPTLSFPPMAPPARPKHTSKLSEGAPRLLRRPVDKLAQLGADLRFYLQVLAHIPGTLRHYPKEVLRLLSEVSFGSGALAVIGGTIGVMLGLTLSVGFVVGMQGYAALDQIGASALNGFISAYFNTREVAPMVAALALSATVGAGFSAHLRPLLQPVPAADRHPAVVRQGADLLGDDHHGALPDGLPGHRRAGRGRRGRRPRRTPQPGGGRGAGPDPLHGPVGRGHHGQDRRMNAGRFRDVLLGVLTLALLA